MKRRSVTKATLANTADGDLINELRRRGYYMAVEVPHTRMDDATLEAMRAARYAVCDTDDDEHKLNAVLNTSQRRLERKIGKPQVNALINSFITETRGNRLMWEQLYSNADPYRWLYERQQQHASTDDAA